MITLTAKINLLSGDNKALSLGSTDLSGNNISSNLSGIVGVKKNGRNPFIIGASKLGDGSTFSDGVDYFIGDQLSDNNGNFLNKYEIEIIGSKIKTITLSFDNHNNRFPKSITIYKIIKSTNKELVGSYCQKLEAPMYGNYTKLEGEWYSYNIDCREIENYIKENNGEITSISIDNLYWAVDEQSQDGVKLNILTQNSTSNFVVGEFSYDDTDFTIPDNGYIYANIIICYNLYETKTSKKYQKISDYSDNDPIWTIFDLPEESFYKIEISNWNVPNYPLVITGIYAEVSIEIDRRNLISISRSIFDRSDLKLPSWGIISNTGNIEFNDTDGEIRDYAEQLLLESGLKCEIKLNNTLVDGASQTIGVFETDEWDYDNDNRVVSVSLKDDLEEWQDINVAEISYDPRKIEHKPFKWFYVELWKLTSNRFYAEEDIYGNGNYNMLAFDELDTDTQDILQNAYIQYPLLESGSLWESWQKLCEVCQLHIYKDNNGVVVCRYNGGN